MTRSESTGSRVDIDIHRNHSLQYKAIHGVYKSQDSATTAV
jgi:hypothetical protein